MPFAPAPYTLGRVNARGLLTLLRYETARWLRSPFGYVIAPVLNTLMLFTVFRLALPVDIAGIGGVPITGFVVPGLVMMAVLHAAFETTAWSIIDLKIRGTIVDLLMPPLVTAELLVAFALNGAARGLLVGALVLGAMAPFAELGPIDVPAALGFAGGGALALALAGIVVGIEARKFDHVATVDNFAVVPLAFLAGTFYAIDDLAEPWHTLSAANPLAHMVTGLRASMITARSDDPLLGVAGVAAAVVVLGLAAWHRLAYSAKLRP
ncbi:MAG: multidrug ABC transporter permease [Alphaproteobacteria bacterium]|nr:multidrug ABC transporter permease [Alphaproteobacteria bacterium]